MNCSPISSAIARFIEPRPHLGGKGSIWLKIVLRSFSLGLMLPTLIIRPVLGAQRLNLSYGLFERSISINSLENYAKTGKADEELSAYLKYTDKKNLPQLRQALMTPIPLNAVQVSQFLYTPIGETLLAKLGEVIQQETRNSGFYAIRSALILAASDPQGFTLLNVLRKFPSDAITIDLGRSLEIANQLKNMVSQTQDAVALINNQSSQNATTKPASKKSLVMNLVKPGSFKWQKQTINLFDVSRQRKFPADIYLPQVSKPCPVIVISHGLGSDRTSFAYLAKHLASYGFVVAVPEHPGSDAKQLQALLAGKAQEVTSPREFIDRPLDVKYLLDELTRLSQSSPVFRGHLNLQQIGVVGQSFGGYTALALAGAPIDFQLLQKKCPPLNNSLNVSLLLQCLAVKLPKSINYNLSDSRVKAAIAIDPVDSSIMGQASLEQIKIPLMIVSGSADTVAPALPEQIRPFTWLTTQSKYLALINGGTHFSTIGGEANDPGAIPLPEQVVGPSPALARRYIDVLSLAFFQTYVAQQPNYQPYLSANYINTISRKPLPLSLVRLLILRQRS